MRRNQWVKSKRKDSHPCSKCEKIYYESLCPECHQFGLCKGCLAIEKHTQLLANAVGKDKVKEIFDPNRRQTIEDRLPGYLPDSNRTNTRNNSW